MSSNIHCDVCKKSKGMLCGCIECGVKICKDCNEHNSTYLITANRGTHQEYPICNHCNQEIEDTFETIAKENLYL